MKLAQDLRRLGIVARKRYSLFKYNLQMKRELGVYDPTRERELLERSVRSLNLFDFSEGKMADFHLLDDFSDATQFGGESLNELSLVSDPERGQTRKPYQALTIVRVRGSHVRERNNLLPIDYMFFGFRSLSLLQGTFMYFNGLRITMKPPSYPCKLGIYVQVSVKEYEHFTVRSTLTNILGAPLGHREPKPRGLSKLRAPHKVVDERQDKVESGAAAAHRR